MAKKVIGAECVIEIVPTMERWLRGTTVSPEDATRMDARKTCDDMIANIKRHVDGVEDIVGRVKLLGECEWCHSIWTEDSSTYNGGCCDKDEQNNPNPAP